MTQRSYSLLDSSINTWIGRLIFNLAEQPSSVLFEGQTLREFLDSMKASGLITDLTVSILEAHLASKPYELPITPSREGSEERKSLGAPRIEEANDVPERRADILRSQVIHPYS